MSKLLKTRKNTDNFSKLEKTDKIDAKRGFLDESNKKIFVN